MEDYEVFIDECEFETGQHLSKIEVIHILNDKLSKYWPSGDHKFGMEIEVEPSWRKVLVEDGSLLWGYIQLGWKVMHYRQERNDGTAREWLSFKSPHSSKIRK